ncbi:MAG: molecular chaperone TorD family protein, partial [Caldilineaceae bacterium]|nr:molecular chaperone TorD family protein [Caldilineaceae bacterium]
YELFGFNLFPYESMFLGDEQLLGTAIGEAVGQQYARLGYVPTQQAGALDHVGEELGVLAYLLAAEADAREDQRVAVVQRLQGEQRQFLEAHLLRWLAPFVIAVQRHVDRFYAEVATITLTLVAERYQTLVGREPASPAEYIGATNGWQLPAPPTLVTDPQTSLRDIAGFLTTPAYSGLYLSRYQINHLGRQLRLPRGFGSREQMMSNLLRTAAQYDAVPALVRGLRTEAVTWQEAYAAVDAAQPGLRPFTAPWLQRVQQTSAMLAEMAHLITREAATG